MRTPDNPSGHRSAHPMKRKPLLSLLIPVAAVAVLAVPVASSAQTPAGARLAVGTQYDSTHVYVTPGSVEAFTTSWEATFGGSNTQPVVTDVTPTPSKTVSELVLSPVGTLSVFDYQTPAPYPFGAERTGWLVTDLEQGVRAAEADGADLVVSPFADPIGQDAVIQFPGGIDTQLYVHDTPPSYAALASVPQNRVYLSPDAAEAFLRSYLRFTGGRITSDDRRADGGEMRNGHGIPLQVRAGGQVMPAAGRCGATGTQPSLTRAAWAGSGRDSPKCAGPAHAARHCLNWETDPKYTHPIVPVPPPPKPAGPPGAGRRPR